MHPSAPTRPCVAPPLRAAAATALAGALAIAASSLSACGGVEYADDAPTSTTASGSVGSQAPAADAVASASAITVGEAEGVGEVTVDADGFTLYRFDSDTADPPTTACTGDCAQAWPPVTVEDASGLTADGIDADLLGTLTRDDGSVQVTLGGWPLYRYAEDAAPGDALGHGVGGTWFAATPTGQRAATDAADAADAADAPTPVDDGYDY